MCNIFFSFFLFTFVAISHSLTIFVFCLEIILKICYDYKEINEWTKVFKLKNMPTTCLRSNCEEFKRNCIYWCYLNLGLIKGRLVAYKLNFAAIFMKKLLDDIFCEKLSEKKMVDKSLLIQLKKKEHFVTLRETLLLDRVVSVSGYISVLTMLQKDIDLVDSQASIDYDALFLAYLNMHNIVEKEDIEACKKYSAASPFRVRELLLATSALTFDKYSKIVAALAKEVAEKDNSEQTLIDEMVPEEANVASNNFPTKKTTLSFVKDSSAETIIDISHQEATTIPEEPQENLKKSPHRPDESEETLIDNNFQASDGQYFNDDATIGFTPEEHLEETADEMATVENNNVENEDSDVTSAAVVQENLENLPKAETKKYSDILEKDKLNSILNTSKVFQPPTERIPSNLPQVSVSENQQPPSKPVSIPVAENIVQNHSASQRIKTVTAPTPKISQEIPPQNTVATSYIADELNAVMMERLVQQVQSQVYLQTQQISQNVGKEISGYKSFYKIIAGMVIFFSLFLLAFTGWIEFQRFQDLRGLRDEKQAAVSQKEQMFQQMTESKDKNVELQLKISKLEAKQEILELQRQEIEKQKISWEEKISELNQQTKQFELLMNSQNEIKQALSTLELANVYLLLNDYTKAQDLFLQSKSYWDGLAKKNIFDELLGIRLVDYMLKYKTPTKEKEAISILETLTSSWVAQWKLGAIYYSQSPMKGDLVKKYWSEALKLNPNLTKVRDQLKLIK